MGLHASVGLLMAGLGASLEVPTWGALRARAAPLTLWLSLMLLGVPVLAALLARALGLPPGLELGLLLIAAAPSGPLSSAFTALVDGDVALALLLVAGGTLASALTMPLVARLVGGAALGPPVATVGFLLLLVAGPLLVGLLLRARAPSAARRLARAVRPLAAIALVIAVVLVVTTQRRSLLEALPAVGLAVLALNLVNLGLGFALGRGAPGPALSLSVRNGTIALALASSPALSADPTVVVPTVVYAGLQSLSTAAVVLAARTLRR